MGEKSSSQGPYTSKERKPERREKKQRIILGRTKTQVTIKMQQCGWTWITL
jgi:hypothetical protein